MYVTYYQVLLYDVIHLCLKRVKNISTYRGSPNKWFTFSFKRFADFLSPSYIIRYCEVLVFNSIDILVCLYDVIYFRNWVLFVIFYDFLFRL